MELRSRVQAAAVLFLLATLFAAASAARSGRVPAIYVFGDSTADVGNNNHLPDGEMWKANYPPNGIDYPGGKPTGRFSNGYIAVDFLAMKMGFKESPPPHFSHRHRCRGVNFASGGSGVLDATGANRSYSLNTQISFFKEMASKSLARSDHLSRSIFIFSTFSNDIFDYYIGSQATSIPTEEEFISSITDQFKGQLKKLYRLGARKFVVLGAGLLGCTPLQRSLNFSGGCADDLNLLAVHFNDAMGTKLHDLSRTSPGLKYSFIDIVSITLNIGLNPSHYGLKVLDEACCGSGRLHAESLCVANATHCHDRNKYVSWDYVHPTQASYKLLADFAYGGSKDFAYPMNVQDLIEA